MRFMSVPVAALALVVGLGGYAAAQDAPSASGSAETKVCFVDLQRALNEVSEGQRARTELESDFERRQTELDRQQTELEAWMVELQDALPMLTPDARAERAAEYEQRMVALQQAFESNQLELAQAEAAATERIFLRMLEVVEEYAREASCSLVLEKSSVLYAASTDMEFTDELIRRYNARH